MNSVINVIVRDTRKYSEEQINEWLDKLPPIKDVKTAGSFLVIECESMLNEKGAWEKHIRDISNSSFQSAAKWGQD